jgi:hypothetical protein
LHPWQGSDQAADFDMRKMNVNASRIGASMLDREVTSERHAQIVRLAFGHGWHAV